MQNLKCTPQTIVKWMMPRIAERRLQPADRRAQASSLRERRVVFAFAFSILH